MELHGKSVFGGIAMGRLSVYHKTDNAVKRTKITDIEAEKKRFEDAKEEAQKVPPDKKTSWGKRETV